MSRLHTFRVDRIKVDRSFVSSLTVGSEHGSIADAIIALGQCLGLDVVAEGVESHEQLVALRNLGCGVAQGYFLSKPVAPQEIERLMGAGGVLVPPTSPDTFVGDVMESSMRQQDRLVRNLLAELQRLTGLESTYLTRIDWAAGVQEVTHALNTGAMDIAEELSADWSDALCRLALERGVPYTDDVPSTFPDAPAAHALGLQTYVSVALRTADGVAQGTLCGASANRVALGPETVLVMERFAKMISHGVVGQARASSAS